MGISPFHRSSFSTFDQQRRVVAAEPAPLPNPDPRNYRVIRFREFSRDHKVMHLPGGEITIEPLYNRLVVEIEYPDCTNYEGRKILYFEDCTMDQLLAQGPIDPHFSDSREFRSPSARFEPTPWGWTMACRFAGRFQVTS